MIEIGYPPHVEDTQLNIMINSKLERWYSPATMSMHGCCAFICSGWPIWNTLPEYLSGYDSIF